jgi:hypothetical protein
MIVINVDIMICIMCDVLLLKCAPSVVLMFKYVLCTLLESNIPPLFVHFILEGRKLFFIFIFGSRPKDNSKEEMEQSYSCIILFISKTKNILLASRFI